MKWKETCVIWELSVCIRPRDFYIGHDHLHLHLYLFFVCGHVPISLGTTIKKLAVWPDKCRLRKVSSPPKDKDGDNVLSNEVHRTSKTAVMGENGAMVNWRFAEGNGRTSEKTPPHCHESHMNSPGTDAGSPQWEGSIWRPVAKPAEASVSLRYVS
jgi:hypothetical protein